MSLANGFNRMDGECSLRRCATNVMTALNVLARPRRVRLPRSDAYSLPMLAIAAGVAIAVFLFLAWALDAAASRGAGHLPRWIISVFDDITEQAGCGLQAQSDATVYRLGKPSWALASPESISGGRFGGSEFDRNGGHFFIKFSLNLWVGFMIKKLIEI